MTLIGQIFWSFSFVFFFCEFGQRVSNAFEDLSDSLNELVWYLLPIEIQRMLPTAMIIFQSPVYVPVAGKISCSRYVFEKVSAIEYFTISNVPSMLFRVQIINRAYLCSVIIIRELQD